MKYLSSQQHGFVSIIEADEPMPGPGEITVRLTMCGVCGTDTLKVFGEFPRPQKLGHEVVGVVHRLGEGVRAFSVGQRVALAHHAPDPNSYFSQHGSETMDPLFKSSNISPGGFSEVILVSALHVRQTVVAIPDGVPDGRAVFMEPMACCLRALDRLTFQAGDTALVVGIGAVGMLFVPLLRDAEVTVLVSDVRQERITAAMEMGAVAGAANDVPRLCKANSDGRGVDVVILTVVNSATIRLALDSVRDGGTVMLFGGKPGTTLSLEGWELFVREINLISSYSATPGGLRRAMNILSDERYAGIENLISHSLPLDQAQAGFDLVQTGKASKVVITGRE